MDEKKKLRHYIKKRLKQVEKRTFESWSHDIRNDLFQSQMWNTAKTIGLTVSTEKEIDTTPIIKEAWNQNKTVVVPQSIPETHEMIFRQIDEFDMLKEGYAGIMEPNEEQTIAHEPTGVDLLIVPGLLFDYQGYRIGYGGGFYDRYLSKYKGLTLSLAFDFQLIRGIPTNEFDLPVDYIITNRKVWSCHDSI